MHLSDNETHHITILIVEQDPQLLSMLEMLFSSGGYEVFCADNGQAALEQATKLRYPLVITGLDVGEMEAVELLSGLMEIDPYIECVLLAEVSELSRVIEASEVGNVYNHFWKPLKDMGELIRTVARALERRELRLNNTHLLAELRDSREERNRLFHHLDHLDKTSGLGQMVQNIDGNIENPLERLLSYGRYLRSRMERSEAEPISAEQMNRTSEYLGEVETSVQKSCDALQHIIDYAIDQDESPREIKIEEVLNEALNVLQPILNAKSILVTLDIAPETPTLILHRSKLRQIIVGIVQNSQQAITESGGIINLSTHVVENADSLETIVQLSIKDNGCGISEEALPHVFEPFFSTYRREDNFGIGLTIARRTIRDWDGDIDIQSDGRNGAQVTLRLLARSA